MSLSKTSTANLNEKVPADIWIEIWKYGSKSSSLEANAMPFLLQLQLVCKGWKEAVEDTAGLWGYINIRSLNTFCLRFLRLQVERSGDTDLHISLNRTCRDIAPRFQYRGNPGISALLAARQRWKTLFVDLVYPMELSHVLLSARCSLPRLDQFHANFTYVVPQQIATNIFSSVATSTDLRTVEWHGRTSSGLRGNAGNPFIHSHLVNTFGLRLSVFTRLSLHAVLDQDFLTLLGQCPNLVSIDILALYIPERNNRSAAAPPIQLIGFHHLERLSIGGYNTDRVLLLSHLQVPPRCEISFGLPHIDLEPFRAFLTRNLPVVQRFHVSLPTECRAEHIEAVEFCLRRTARDVRDAGIFLHSNIAVSPPIPCRKIEAILLPALTALTLKCHFPAGEPLHLPFLGKLQAPSLTHLLIDFPGPCLADTALFLCHPSSDPGHGLVGDISGRNLDGVVGPNTYGPSLATDAAGNFRFWGYLQSMYLLLEEEEESKEKERPGILEDFARVRPATTLMEGYAYFHAVADPDILL
ncbi:hypothetical protein VNI00_016521 [Paramarasmius palmivorus]|uniref:F-box domain-containing protein n=1 Tax=Paramarasmius palmivorus TaxID=297713 RepID=A0AAW0BDM9_9AGAR